MAAAPFFHSFMTSYLADKPNDWYARPDTIKTVEFPTVVGKIADLMAPWQSPSDRFNKRVAEIDDPNWNRAISGYATVKDQPKDVASQPNTVQSPQPTKPTPVSSPVTAVRAEIPPPTEMNSSGRGRTKQ
jgi:membrane carboxypeptidase/penicillin-binding protein